MEVKGSIMYYVCNFLCIRLCIKYSLHTSVAWGMAIWEMQFKGKKGVEIGQCCSILSVVHINFLVLSSTLDPLGTTKPWLFSAVWISFFSNLLPSQIVWQHPQQQVVNTSPAVLIQPIVFGIAGMEMITQWSAAKCNLSRHNGVELKDTRHLTLKPLAFIQTLLL